VSIFASKIYSTFALVAALSVATASHAQAKLVPASTPQPTGAGRPQHDVFPDDLITAHVRDGVLTIDGMVAKVQLNYEIDHMGYMYFFVPGVGTAVVSMGPLVDGVKIADGFDGDKLAFTVDGHSVELSSGTSLLAKHKKADVYVRLDHSTVAISRYPRMGYGDTTQAPYMWPLSNPELGSKEKVAYVVPPPPTPKNMLPQTASTTSPH